MQLLDLVSVLTEYGRRLAIMQAIEDTICELDAYPGSDPVTLETLGRLRDELAEEVARFAPELN